MGSRQCATLMLKALGYGRHSAEARDAANHLDFPTDVACNGFAKSTCDIMLLIMLVGINTV